MSLGEDDQESSTSSSSSSSSLAAKAIRASSAHMESSLSSAYSPRSYAPSSVKVYFLSSFLFFIYKPIGSYHIKEDKLNVF